MLTPSEDFLLSVLETTVTKRDARAYINKFVLHGPKPEPELEAQQEPMYVAVVKFRAPHEVDDTTLLGVGRTLGQLRKLGLISIVVVDCDAVAGNAVEQRRVITQQAERIAMAIDSYDEPGARIVDSPITIGSSIGKGTSPYTSDDLFISQPYELMNSLQEELIPIIPSVGYKEDTCTFKCVDANEAVIALARQLSGLQFLGQPTEDAHITKLLRAAEVYRLIVLDPVGGIPARNRATGRYMFLNMAQEFDEVTKHLDVPASPADVRSANYHHLRNTELAKRVLSLLPPTSSAVITTPQEVVNDRRPDKDDTVAFVGTRRKLNPLIHNLLTDKPVQSSSLPPGRFRPVVTASGAPRIGSLTTLAKKGMPLTIFPNPQISPWKLPQPGESRLRLTDSCVDLPRLVHLIDDSFGRKLDVEAYLKRVNENIAGIIIAGEYEGGAILTWEKPFREDGSETIDPSRMVPYLDKFAVLRKSQGAGGVADIVFNAMVRDCFPEGVCWRSRKDNPVNKWYFERSRGTHKLSDMNWTMFWTTPDLTLDEQKYRDYESVCRGVEPSWADKKHILD
ncbi:uncharacterized protein BCR38DRAFT_341187 [Pseudomassariella vexata]|uniref:Amino-acid acetyltransferase, mitochondrial n=1 Tax=Pseudomassariella vexata TaxID=1141098 RepID=A0A1Y2E044_9PEZI|nr:uncharacterized protein BCR38DRAFT_341187 [Pseudomassariella vexata]ORY64901.1 hypothetical protein BCR38DRAFT_341187 [Pseudomassariella vexata]